MSTTHPLSQTIAVGDYALTCSLPDKTAAAIACSVAQLEEGLHALTVTVTADSPIAPPALTIDWRHPMVDTHLRWVTQRQGAVAIIPWRRASSVESKATRNAPVYGLMDMAGRNRLTFAISDAVNDTILRATLSEEEADLACSVEVTARTAPLRETHELVLRLDTRALDFGAVLGEVSNWWASIPELKPMPVPEHTRLPMYSTWYSFHQHLTPAGIEEQCRLAKAMGMESVIVDDGWQTDDTARGYAYCGDWEPVPGKFPDFKGHIERVQALGMKYLLWFSVPFVGKHSAAYERFRDCLLPAGPEAQWWCLDPRRAKARAYLIETYERYVRDYGLDGLKLDFVDSFSEPPADADLAPLGPEDEHTSVAEAAASLLAEIADRLQALDPAIMLEFRQSYIGPAMRRCGNIFRVGDVPNDFHSNRINGVDLRLLSGNTAVHADMMMWHPEDSVESAAMQLVHTLFLVPQISVMIDQIPESHRRMLAHYLAFWREHRDVLLDGKIRGLEPGMLYPQVQAQTTGKWLAAVYGETVVTLPPKLPARTFLVNGTWGDTLVLRVAADGHAGGHVTVRDCQGQGVAQSTLDLGPGLHELAVPPAGYAIITK